MTEKWVWWNLARLGPPTPIFGHIFSFKRSNWAILGRKKLPFQKAKQPFEFLGKFGIYHFNIRSYFPALLGQPYVTSAF